MIYQTYQLARIATRPLAAVLDAGQRLARHENNPLRDTVAHRAFAVACELPLRALKEYPKQPFAVRAEIGDQQVLLTPRVVDSLPFADLVNFEVDDAADKPKVLVAAALSGHHATLLDDTMRGFARDFDPYITDWKDAREVPKEAGSFGFDDYVAHLIRFMEVLGPDTHLVATCQAAPPAMVAAAILAKRNPDCAPATLTLMGGPIDTRVSPMAINNLADKLPLKAFEVLNIHKIPWGHAGSGRKVYPGFYQLTGFIMLNPKPHFRSYFQFVKDALRGDEEALEKFREFYDEYFAVLDMDKDFYLETLQKVFTEHHIPTGQMTYEGELVDFAAVENLSLLTVEGANDNFCPPGQTVAAHEVFSGIPEDRRRNYVQEGVGHYGVFSGSKFQASIYPVIRDFIQNGGKPAKQAPVLKIAAG